jgi:hypothetical protein
MLVVEERHYQQEVAHYLKTFLIDKANNKLYLITHQDVTVTNFRGETVCYYSPYSHGYRSLLCAVLNSNHRLVLLGRHQSLQSIVELNETITEVVLRGAVQGGTGILRFSAVDEKNYVYFVGDDRSLKIYDDSYNLIKDLGDSLRHETYCGLTIFKGRIYMACDKFVRVLDLDGTPLFQFNTSRGLGSFTRIDSFFINDFGELFVGRDNSVVQVFNAYTGSFITLFDLQFNRCCMIHDIGLYFTMFVHGDRNKQAALITYSYRSNGKSIWTNNISINAQFSDISIICFERDNSFFKMIDSEDFADQNGMEEDHEEEYEDWTEFFTDDRQFLADTKELVSFIIKQQDDIFGMHYNEVYEGLSATYSSEEISKFLKYLRFHGFIYNTIDTHHLKCDL